MNVAAIDCGTNSTRLLILDGDGKELHRDLRLTRLGEGVDENRRLSDAAIDRTVRALQEFYALTQQHQVGQIRIAATSAARDAQNVDAFFGEIEAIFHQQPELLSGEEEARLTYAGATGGLRNPPYLVVDIGGGSTELVVGDDTEIRFARSLDLGCVRLTEQSLRGDPYSAEELSNAFSIATAHIREVAPLIQKSASRFQLIGVAGTITSLAAIELGLTSYQPLQTHGHVLSRETVEQLLHDLSRQTTLERESDPLLPPKRSDVIVAGIVILLAIMRELSIDGCQVSETDILDGLAQSIQK